MYKVSFIYDTVVQWLFIRCSCPLHNYHGNHLATVFIGDYEKCLLATNYYFTLAFAPMAHSFSVAEKNIAHCMEESK